MKRIDSSLAALAVLTAAGLLWKTREVAEGVRAGLTACAGVVIPSLFPFMILAGLLCATRAGAALSRAVSGFTRRVLGLPENLGAVFLMSFLGGFPVGARMLSDLLGRRETDRETAERALCFCVNAGPSFLISAVGAGMLGSRMAGLSLLAAQVLSSLVIGAALFRSGPVRKCADMPPMPMSGRGAFVSAVQSASAGILGICAFVTAFSAAGALLRALGITGALARILGVLFPTLGEPFFSAALTGVLEVTGGCMAAAGLHGLSGYLLCAFLVSFSSLSIIFQVQSCFPAQSGVQFQKFYLSRLAHGALTTIFAALFWRLLPPAALSAAAVAGTPVPRADPAMAVTAVCLICMCSMLLLPAPKRNLSTKRNVHN